MATAIPDFKVQVVVQGSHGVPVDKAGIKRVIALYGAHLYQVMFDQGMQGAQKMLSDVVEVRGIVAQLRILAACQEDWVFQAEAAYIPGNSHYGAGTMRVSAVTDFNTLFGVVQSGNADSRRKGNLCLPADFSGDKSAMLLTLFECFSVISRMQDLLSGPISGFDFNATLASREETICNAILQGDEAKARNHLEVMADQMIVGEKLGRVFRNRNSRLIFLGDFLERAGGVDTDCPSVSLAVLQEVAANVAAKLGINKGRLNQRLFVGYILDVLAAKYRLLHVDLADDRCELGEFGHILREELLVDLQKQEQLEQEKRQKSLEKERVKLLGEIPRLQAELDEKTSRLAEIDSLLQPTLLHHT